MLCKQLGAGYAVSEMVTSRKELWNEPEDEPPRRSRPAKVDPIAVQIAGTDAAMMAEAAAYNIDRGAQIIDINMGCPAKKVCSKWAGSALMQDEPLATRDYRGGGRRLRAAQRAGDAEDAHRLVRQRAQRRAHWRACAEAAGVAMVTVHGRTREQGYKGAAEYDTIAAVKAAVAIPGGRQRRHRLARARPATVLEATARRRDHDRPRRAGPAVDLPRDRTLPRHRRGARRRRRDAAGQGLVDRPPARPLRPVWRIQAGVRSARKHIGWAVRAPAWRRGLS